MTPETTIEEINTLPEPTEAQLYKMSLALCGIPISDETAELLIIINKKFNELGGEFSIKDAVTITSAFDAEQRRKRLFPKNTQPTNHE